MHLDYDVYLDKVLGGWIGKSAGGAIGARFEGTKAYIEISPEEMFPDEMPPNDDLDLQVLWLKVLEEKGAALTSDDLAEAWLDGCWYPFNEYGIFRRNWQLGIHPPMSGRFTNQFWETGEGCPIRSEIWGYVFPGAPDLAAKYAYMDGTLDHTEQSVGAEMMFAAMASMAFFVDDVRRLTGMFIHYLPEGSPIERMTREVFRCYDAGISLRETRDRIMYMAGHPEACDSQINVPFTFIGLLWGENDMVGTLLSALKCGYDTDCTLASAGAFIGQIVGASGLPANIVEPVGDDLVMGIQYNRPEMTLSALARDTARMGVLLADQCATDCTFDGVPQLESLPPAAVFPETQLVVEYAGLPEAAPGDTVDVVVRVEGVVPEGELSVTGPDGWAIAPATAQVGPLRSSVKVSLHAPEDADVWPQKNLFTVRLGDLSYTFGVAGAQLWKLIGVHFDAVPGDYVPKDVGRRRRFNHHFVSLERDFIPEPVQDVDGLFATWSERIGKRAVVPAYERVVDPSCLVGLRGPLVFYLARTVISPDDRLVHIGIGNTDSYRLWVNGELVGEADEATWWTPFNNVHSKVALKKGVNEIVLKMVRPRDETKLTFGMRSADLHPYILSKFKDRPRPEGAPPPDPAMAFNVADWVVDLADEVP